MRLTRIVSVALVVTLAAGCSGGGKKHGEAETSSKEFTRPAADLLVTRTELVSPHQAIGPLDKGTTRAVVDVVEKLLTVTSALPLGAGRAGGGFAALFTPDAGARAATQDRAAFFDEGLPLFGDVKPKVARVGLTGLAGSMDPATAMVVARFVWDITSAEHRGDRVLRTGELTLVPSHGAWKIGAYTFTVKRTIDRQTTTTTATTR